MSYAGEVFQLIMNYLIHLCLDDIVPVDDHLNIVTSSFSVLLAVFIAWEANENYLTSGIHVPLPVVVSWSHGKKKNPIHCFPFIFKMNRLIYINKVITTMVIRPLDDST